MIYYVLQMLTVVRFLFLVILYAVFHVKHWWPVAVSTAISDAALILKIFAIFPGFGVSFRLFIDFYT